MTRDTRNAVAALTGGALLLVLGVFVVIASQPVLVQDFGFVGGQGQAVHIGADGAVVGPPWFLSRATGGILLAAGSALAAGVAGYALGGRRQSAGS